MYTMVSPLHPGHPSVGMPPVYSPRNLAAPTATAMMASLTSISSPHPGQRERYASGSGPKGSSRPSCGSGSWCLRRILPSPHGFQLIMNHAILRVPYLPYPHLCFAVRTAQGISTGTGLVAFSIALGRNNLDGPLDDA